MKKFAEEVVKYFWIPLIMALVSYIFFQVKDVVLGIIVLVSLSAVYTLVRFYFIYKKWWLLIILMVVIVAGGSSYFLMAPTISLSINGDRVTAAQININGGSVQVSPAPFNGLYTKGTVVTLTANAGSGKEWKNWVGTQNDNANPTTIKMDSSRQIRVNFEGRYSLIINNEIVIGSMLHFTEGDISVSPAPDGDGKYKSGTEVTLSVRTNTGYDWKNWTGTENDNTNPTTVIMSGGNKNVNVDFEGRFTFIIDDHLVIGSSMTLADGTVNVNPAPGEDGKYAYGTTITITAIPDTGYGWKNWTGTANDNTNPTAVTINSDKHVAVSFEERYLVMLNNQALKTGVISVTGGAISADPAPGEDYRYTRNSVVMFTAVPAAGYRFDKWSGDVSDTVTMVSVVMDGNKSISAGFIKVYNLSASVNISAGGTLSTAGGTYDTGTEITLTATPAAGYRFEKWTGDVSGDTPSVLVTMNNDITAIANFIKTYLLTVSVTPEGGGTVTPGSGVFDTGTEITLTAAPADGYVFSGWEGVSGNETTVSVTMTEDISITAKFAPAP